MCISYLGVIGITVNIPLSLNFFCTELLLFITDLVGNKLWVRRYQISLYHVSAVSAVMALLLPRLTRISSRFGEVMVRKYYVRWWCSVFPHI